MSKARKTPLQINPAVPNGPATDSPATAADSPRIKGAVVAGSIISALFLIGFVVWGSLAPVASASIATGVVGAEGKTRTMQHLEGGIVEEIVARDGDHVTAGDVLMRLDDTKARAMFDLLLKRRMIAQTELARLRAEQSGEDEISFPARLAASDDAAVLDMIKRSATATGIYLSSRADS